MAVIDQLSKGPSISGSIDQFASGLKPNMSNLASDFPWVKLVRDASPLEDFRTADAQNLVILDVVMPSPSAIGMLELVRQGSLAGTSEPYRFIIANPPFSGGENEDFEPYTVHSWWELSGGFPLKASEGIPSGSSGSTGAAEKIVATFSGRVEFIRGDVGGVLLINDKDHERLDSRCSLDVLQANNLGEGDEFRCEVLRRGGETITRLIKLSPKEVSRQRIQHIEQEFKGRWPF